MKTIEDYCDMYYERMQQTELCIRGTVWFEMFTREFRKDICDSAR